MGLMTSFPGIRCGRVSEWKMETRSSPVCDAFTRARPLISGKTNWVRQWTSHKGGGKQGDPLMPLLFALGNTHLEAVQGRLLDGEKLFAYLDNVYIICQPDRVADVHAILEEGLFNHTHIQLNLGKTKVIPAGVAELTAAARQVKEDAIVWRGDPELCPDQQGVKVLGTSIGPEFVTSHPSLVLGLERDPAPSLRAVRVCQQTLICAGFEAPRDVLFLWIPFKRHRLRAFPTEEGMAAKSHSSVDKRFASQFTAELGEVDQALMRSQHGPGVCSLHSSSHQPPCEDQFAILPPSSLQAPSPPHSLVLTHLPMWPST